jgi:hypothetical protein
MIEYWRIIPEFPYDLGRDGLALRADLMAMGGGVAASSIESFC